MLKQVKKTKRNTIEAFACSCETICPGCTTSCPPSSCACDEVFFSTPFADITFNESSDTTEATRTSFETEWSRYK